MANNFIPIPDKPGTWKIAEMYEKALNIAKNYKTLLILGLSMGLFTGGCNANSSWRSNLPSGIFEKGQSVPKNIEQSGNVLGTSTDIFYDLAGKVFNQIPLTVYILLGIELLFLILFWIAISFLGKSWSQAGLIIGSYNALSNKKLSLSEISNLSFPRIKSLLWLSIVPTAAIIFTFILLLTLSVILIATGIKVLGIIFIILTVISFLISILFYTISLIFAQRAAAIDSQAGFPALKIGFKMSKKKFWAALLLGIVNSIVSMIIMLVPVAILLGIVFSGAFLAIISGRAGLPIITAGAILVLALLLIAFPLIGSILTVFKTAVWNQAYEKTKEVTND